jgi:hypothetical protein
MRWVRNESFNLRLSHLDGPSLTHCPRAHPECIRGCQPGVRVDETPSCGNRAVHCFEEKAFLLCSRQRAVPTGCERIFDAFANPVLPR